MRSVPSVWQRHKPLPDRQRPAAGRRRSFVSLLVVSASAAALLAPMSASAAPSTPTGLKVTANGPQQVALAWTPPSEPVTGYRVYRDGGLIGTTDKYTANYLDASTSLSNGTSYAYSVEAFDGSGSSARTDAVNRSPVSAAPRTSCPDTSPSSVHYKLTQNLVAPAGKPCFRFANGTNDSIDCQGFSITQNEAISIIEADHTAGVLITNCTLIQNSPSHLINVTDGSAATIVGNTFLSPSGANLQVSVNIERSPNAVIAGNHFTRAYFETHNAPSAYVAGNDFVQTEHGSPCSIWITQSDHSIVVKNTIDGGYPGFPAPNTGNDDGINLPGPNTDLTVNENTISHVFDAGIEPESTLTASHLDGNTIDDAAFAGIGEYHDTDFRDNWVTGNHVTNTPHFVQFASDHQSAFVLPSKFAVSGNHFTGNTLSSPKAVDPYDNLASGVQWKIATSDSAPGLIAESANNTFQDNDFGQNGEPITFIPTGAATSPSTGNLCPLGGDAAVECLGPPVVTRGQAPFMSSVTGRWTLAGHVAAHGAATTTAIEWGTTASYGSSGAGLSVNADSQRDVGILIPSQTPGTTIHFRAVATNAKGTTYGADQSFVIPAAGSPVVTPGLPPVRDRVTGTWTLGGNVDPQGSTTQTQIEYGSTTSYGASITTSSVAAGAKVDVTTNAIPIQTPGTTLHYRVVATNANGTTYGADQALVIPTGAAVITPVAPFHRNDGAWVLSGRVDPQGLATTTRILWGAGAAGTDPNKISLNQSVDTQSVSVGQPRTAAATIPAQPSGTTIKYQVAAFNAAYNTYEPVQTIVVP